MATQFSGGTYISASFAATTKWAIMQALMQNLATNVSNAGWTNLALASGQGPGNQGTVTVTIASPGVVTFTGHGFLGGEQIKFVTTGALPTGITAGTTYFVKFVGANTFNIATTLGGTNINTSGSQSGTHTCYTKSVILQSATQANVTNPICVTLQDNGGNCVQVSISNSAFTINGGNGTSNGGSLLPNASINFQIIATRYWFVCFLLTVTGVRKFIMAGMLYAPAVLTSITDLGFMLSDSANDTDTSARGSFRTDMNIAGNSGNNPNSQIIYNANLLENANTVNFNRVGSPTTAFLTSFSLGNADRWANDALLSSDVFLTSGLTSTSDESKIKGQFFDMLYIGTAFAADSTDTFNSHNWWNLSNNPTLGGAWVATS